MHEQRSQAGDRLPDVDDEGVSGGGGGGVRTQ